MAGVIFGGPNNYLKSLKSGIQLGTSGAAIASVSVNPTSVATAGNAGDLVISTSTNKAYQKQDDGTTTNWSELQTANAISFAAVGSTPNANGGSVSGSTLTLQPASGSFPGAVTTGAQTLAGVKTFSSAPIMSSITASATVVTDGNKALSTFPYSSSNTVGSFVTRDGSGNFSAGTISANLTAVSVNVQGLSPSQTVVSDGSKNLASIAYGSSNTVGTFVTRDGSGNFAANNITLAGLGASHAVTTDGSKQFSSFAYGGNVQTFLGTPSSANLAAAVSDETGSGALVFATSPTLATPILGTPQSGTLTSCTGLPISTGVSGLGTGVATFLGTPSSANLATAVTDETGSGALVFGTAPTFTTSITDPLVIGGTGTGSSLELRSTSGVGATDFIKFNVGNNGGTEAMRIINNGNIGLAGATSPGAKLDIGTNVEFTGSRLRLNGYADVDGTDSNLEIGDALGSVYWRIARNSDNAFRTDMSNTWGIMGGNVGIGTVGPLSKLDILGGGNCVTRMTHTSASSNIWNSGPDAGGNYIIRRDSDSVGVILTYGANTWATTSDKNSKKDIQHISGALDKVKKISGVRFKYKHECHTDCDRIGVIAQDVQSVLPEAVSELADGTLVVRYTDLIPVLFNAINELSDQVEQLKSGKAIKSSSKKYEEAKKKSIGTRIFNGIINLCNKIRNR